MAQIAELPDGDFTTVGQNETALDSHVDDPPKHRLGIVRLLESWGRSLGAFAFDLVHTNGSREEMVLIQGKETEDHEGHKTRGGELYLGLKIPNSGSSDDAMFDALVANVRDGFRFNLPISAPNLTSGAPSPFQFEFKHPNGVIWGSFQGDGNLVLYRNRVPFDYATGEPYWSTNTVVNP